MNLDERLHVSTLNVWHETHALAERVDAAIAHVNHNRPHVLCLQEVRIADRPLLGEHRDVAHAIAAATGMQVAALKASFPVYEDRSGVAILTSLPFRDSAELDLPASPSGHDAAVSAWVQAPSGRWALAVTTHLAWGNRVEPHRVRAAVFLDDFVQRQVTAAADTLGYTPVAFLTGDFNTGPESQTQRFLTGSEGVEEHGTLWLDTWSVAGSGSGFTSTPENPWAATTARSVGIHDPSVLPERRIDFVMVNGWAYGKPGYPLAAGLTYVDPAGPGDVAPSDHYGVDVALWDPHLEAVSAA